MDKQRGDYFDTDTKFWAWFSSQLRKIWRDHPTRFDFIKHSRFTKRVGNRPIYHITCSMCGKDFPLKEIEINHKVKCGNIKEAGYALRMMDVGFEDLEPLCKPCHAIVTYAERQGISVDESRVEKRVIAFAKLPVAEQKAILGNESKAKNAKERKDEYRNLIKEK